MVSRCWVHVCVSVVEVSWCLPTPCRELMANHGEAMQDLAEAADQVLWDDELASESTSFGRFRPVSAVIDRY